MSTKPKHTGSDVPSSCHAHHPPNDLYHVALLPGLQGLVRESRGTWVTLGRILPSGGALYWTRLRDPKWVFCGDFYGRNRWSKRVATHVKRAQIGWWTCAMIQEALPLDILKTREGQVKRSKENKRKEAQRWGDRDDGVAVGTAELPVCPEQLSIRIFFFFNMPFLPCIFSKNPMVLRSLKCSWKPP